MPYLLVPQLCRFSTCPPYVSEKLQYWHSLPDVIKLPQMAALNDLINFVSHAFSDSWDLTSLLEQIKNGSD